MKAPNCVKLTPEQIEALLDRIEKRNLLPDDFSLLVELVRAMVWLSMSLQEKELSIARLKKVFGIKTESAERLAKFAKGDKSGSNDTDAQATLDGSKILDDAQEPSASGSEETPSDAQPKEGDGSQRQGHGHRGSEEYKEAKIIDIAHQTLQRGSVCPKCLKGKLFNLKPGTVLQIVGQPWLQVNIYRPERLRCSACGEVFSAKLPTELVTQSRADVTAKAIVSILKYRGGVPFYRQEGIQEILGAPISASEIWQMTEYVADCALPVFNELCTQAAQKPLLHNDDTKAQVLDLLKEIKQQEDSERKGMFTTAILGTELDGSRPIALFFTGRKYAAENLDHILDKREDASIPIQECDGLLTRNISKKHETKLANCNSHARRKFYDIVSWFPKECLHIISLYGKIFGNDKMTQEMSPEGRLSFHQMESKALMDQIFHYCNGLLDNKEVEPNSSLGKAIKYLNNHREELTLFLREPGVPLTNNANERLIKRFVLNRKNAYFFKTETGAKIADILMSTIETCSLNGINPYSYLVDIQKNKEAVFACPSKWLPWNYVSPELRL